MYEWITDKILPTLGLGIFLAVVNMYVEFTSMKKAGIEYRTATKEIRAKDALAESKQWGFIKAGDEDMARLQERCISKDTFYQYIIKHEDSKK